MRFFLWFTLIGMAMLAIVGLSAPGFLEATSASAVTVAAAICLVAAVIALLPLALVAPRFPDYLVQAGMGAMLIRLFLSLGGGALYLYVFAPPKGLFMTAMVIFYLVMLVAETAVTLRLVHRYWRPPHAG